MTAPAVVPPTTVQDGYRVRTFPGLDAVRALGAGAVVATHVAFQTGRSTQGPLSGTLARFDIGVALFFVLSGFLLFRPWAVASVTGRPAPAVRAYLWRRALRILPAYWLAVALCLVLLPENAGMRGPAVWLRHLTLTQIYSTGLQRYGLTQTWSLCTEVLFYLLLPALAALVLRRKRPFLALAVVASLSVGWQLLITRTDLVDARIAVQWLPGYLDWFAGGMALALVQVHLAEESATSWMRSLRELAGAPGTCWGAAVALFAVATSPIAGPRGLEGLPTAWEASLKNLLYGAVAVLVVLPLVLGVQRQSPWDRVLGSRVALRLGEISYGVFLWHLLVLQTVVRVLGQGLFTGSWVEVFVVTAAVSVVVATASYVLLERPVLRFASRGPGRTVAHTKATATRQST